MTELEQYLTSKEDAGISPVELRVLGVKAASQFIQEKRPLNESIADMAKEGGLGLEQVRRVVEYANNETFNRLFRAGYDNNITFPMADASAVLQTAETVKTASVKAPSLPKGRYIPGQEYVNLDDAFGTSDTQMEKTAGLTDSERHVKSLEFVDSNREKANLEAMLEITADSFMIKLNGLKDKCKEASNSGYEPSTIGAAIELADPSDGLLGIIKADFGGLVDFGHMRKLSMGGMELMPGNPVTGLTQELEGISGKLVSTQQAIQQVQIAMSGLLSILRGPAPGSAMANTVFNPGGMGSQPAPPPSAEGAAPQGGPQGGPPQSAPPQGGPPEGAAGPPPSSQSQGELGQLFGGGR